MGIDPYTKESTNSPTIMKVTYHNNCSTCPDTFWTEDAWKNICPSCEVEQGTQTIEYLTAREIIRKFEDYLTPEEKAMLEAHGEHYKKMSNR